MDYVKELKDIVIDRIEKGQYVLHGDELTFTLDPEEWDKKYIYKSGNEFRVIIPHADDPSDKISVGYFKSRDEARRARDEYLRKENALHGVKKAQKALGKGKNSEDSGEETPESSQISMLEAILNPKS